MNRFAILKSCHFSALCAILTWALANVITRAVIGWFTPLALSSLRFFFAAAAMLAIVLIKRIPPPAPRDLPLVVLAGATGFALYAIAIGNSARTLNASTSSLMVATAPVLTALAAARIYSERIRPLGWAAIALEFSGILVLTLGHGALSINAGLLWAFLSALSMCCYNLVQRRLTKTYSALSVTAYGIFAAAILQMFCLPDAFVQLAAVPLPVFFGLLYLGIFSSALGYLVWSHALSLAQKTSDVTNWMFLNPLMTTLFGVLLLGEFPDLPTLLGGGIILTGLLLFHRFTQETHPANGSSPH